MDQEADIEKDCSIGGNIDSCESPNWIPWTQVTYRSKMGEDKLVATSVDANNLVTKKEVKIREKARILVKNKVEAKFRDVEGR